MSETLYQRDGEGNLMLAEQEPTSRRVKVSVWFLAAVISFSLAASGFALFDRFATADQRRTALEIEARQQARFNERIRTVSLDYCKEIEKLKQGQREEAAISFRNLGRDAKLLGITLTPELRAASKASYKRKLRRYAESPCPRPPTKG